MWIIVVYIVAIVTMVSALIGLTLDQLYFAEKIKIWLTRCICYLFATKVPQLFFHRQHTHKINTLFTIYMYMYLIRSPTSHSQARNPAFGYLYKRRKAEVGLGNEGKQFLQFSKLSSALQRRTGCSEIVCLLAQCAWRYQFNISAPYWCLCIAGKYNHA